METDQPKTEMKIGIDDAIAAGGLTAEQLKALVIERTNAAIAEPSKKLDTLLERSRAEKIVFVMGDPAGTIFHDGKAINETAYQNLLADWGRVHVPRGEGSASIKASEALKESPSKPKVDRVVWHPDREPCSTYEWNGKRVYNSFKGLGIEPVEGDTSYFDRLLDAATAEEPRFREWLEQWCAYPLQHLGAKQFTALVLFGKQGSGKSLLGNVLGCAYGDSDSDHYEAISQKTLHSDFNGWAQHKLLVLADEISGSDKRTDSDFLKGVITQKTVRINEKYAPAYRVEDHCNYIITSNHDNAIFIEGDDDRRYLVLHLPEKQITDEMGKEIAEWAESPEGRSALLYRLLHADLTGYSPTAKAPMTLAKAKMMEAGRSDLDIWAHDVMASPEGVLPGNDGRGVPDLWRIDELAAAYKQSRDINPPRVALGKALVRAGAFKTERVRTDRGQINLYVVSNVARWKATGLIEIGTAFNESWSPRQKKF